MSSLHHKRSFRADDTQQARLVALQQFVKGDRVWHRTTRKVGSFIESHSGFALPEVWVQFDSECEITVPLSCNPLELELVERNSQDRDIQSRGKLFDVEQLPIVSVEVLSELTEQEALERHRLELKVERAFYEAAIALKELHERKLYRSTHSRFDHYCRERFGFSQQNADLLIRAAGVIDNLKVTTIGCNFLPTSERQVRPLSTLEPNEQRQVWQQAVEAAGNRVPSGRIVKSIVMQLKEKPMRYATQFCNKGDVFTLIGLEGNVRKYNRCPCVAVELNEFTIMVDVYDATIMVKPENLNRIDSPDVVHQLPATLNRIKRLQQCNLDRGAIHVLRDLGRQTYLTHLEEKLLAFLEREYGID